MNKGVLREQRMQLLICSKFKNTIIYIACSYSDLFLGTSKLFSIFGSCGN